MNDGLFSSKTKVKTLAQPWQIQGQAELATQAKPPAYQRIQRAGQPYPGQLVAPMSAQEETSLSQLSRFQGDTAMGGENPLYGTGGNVAKPAFALPGRYGHGRREPAVRGG